MNGLWTFPPSLCLMSAGGSAGPPWLIAHRRADECLFGCLCVQVNSFGTGTYPRIQHVSRRRRLGCARRDLLALLLILGSSVDGEIDTGRGSCSRGGLCQLSLWSLMVCFLFYGAPWLLAPALSFVYTVSIPNSRPARYQLCWVGTLLPSFTIPWLDVGRVTESWNTLGTYSYQVFSVGWPGIKQGSGGAAVQLKHQGEMEA